MIFSAVWYNHVSVLCSCDCLYCVVQSRVCTRKLWLSLLCGTITCQDDYGPCFDLEGFKGNKTYPKYNTFYVADASTNYTLHLSGYSGKAGKLVLLVLRILQQLLMSSYNHQEIIVFAVWYNHVSVLGNCDDLYCVVQSRVCTSQFWLSLLCGAITCLY